MNMIHEEYEPLYADEQGRLLGVEVNYVSVEVLWRAALSLLSHNPTCCWEADEPISSPCGEPAEYLWADGHRESASGDTEYAPQWRCAKHMELDAGGRTLGAQPLFWRSSFVPNWTPPEKAE